MSDTLEIVPLTPERWDALAGLFGATGDARWCWCQFMRTRGAGGGRAEAKQNRERLRAQASAGGVAPGLVALRGDRAVGWVSVGPRDAYERLVHATVLAPVDDRPAWSVVCFVVAKAERGRGVAAALLEGAVAYAREHGATLVEAYPAHSGTGRVPPGAAAAGPLPLYEKAGFSVVAWRRASPATKPRPIVRRELPAAGAPGS